MNVNAEEPWRTITSESMTIDTQKNSKRLIVSFTSYPARIHLTKQVLDSLYVQNLKADKILLWLAEEQFPNKESDLPETLVADAQAGKFELRWCDDIGSHKKYFYAMQEFPADIIVTVDDDMTYHPDMLKTLYESYLRYPTAVSALLTKLILFDDDGIPLPPNDWIYDFTQLSTPSMQLMAIGVGGVLYPPKCLDSRVFDKATICSNLTIGDTYCSDDIWLKTHETLAGVPTVLASQIISRRHIKDSQDTALWKRSPGISHTDTHFAAIHRHYCHDGKDELYEGLGVCLQYPGYIPDGRELNFDLVIKDIELKVAVAKKDNWGDPARDYLPDYIRRALSVINRQMSREADAGAERECMNRLRNIALSISGIDDIAKKDISLRALIEYRAVLRKSMWGAYRTPADYTQMQSNWEAFFKEHPDCDPVYKKGYGFISIVEYHHKKMPEPAGLYRNFFEN